MSNSVAMDQDGDAMDLQVQFMNDIEWSSITRATIVGKYILCPFLGDAKRMPLFAVAKITGILQGHSANSGHVGARWYKDICNDIRDDGTKSWKGCRFRPDRVFNIEESLDLRNHPETAYLWMNDLPRREREWAQVEECIISKFYKSDKDGAYVSSLAQRGARFIPTSFFPTRAATHASHSSETDQEEEPSEEVEEDIQRSETKSVRKRKRSASPVNTGLDRLEKEISIDFDFGIPNKALNRNKKSRVMSLRSDDNDNEERPCTRARSKSESRIEKRQIHRKSRGRSASLAREIKNKTFPSARREEHQVKEQQRLVQVKLVRLWEQRHGAGFRKQYPNQRVGILALEGPCMSFTKRVLIDPIACKFPIVIPNYNLVDYQAIRQWVRRNKQEFEMETETKDMDKNKNKDKNGSDIKVYHCSMGQLICNSIQKTKLMKPTMISEHALYRDVVDIYTSVLGEPVSAPSIMEICQRSSESKLDIPLTPPKQLDIMYTLAWFDYCGNWFGNGTLASFPMDDIKLFLGKMLLVHGGTLVVTFNSRPGCSKQGILHHSHGLAAAGFLHRTLIECGYKPLYTADQCYRCSDNSSPYMSSIFITVE